MAYQSKTWSLSDEVVAEIERRVQVMKARTGSGSPNRVLLEALAGSYKAGKNGDDSDAVRGPLTLSKERGNRKPLLKPSEKKG